MRNIILSIISVVYLLASNIFSHAFAMDIVYPDDTGCTMHASMQDVSNQVDTTCYESCLGAYDELSPSVSLDLLRTYTKVNQGYDFSLSFVESDIFHASLYRQQIDSGGWCAFHDVYVHITKKLE